MPPFQFIYKLTAFKKRQFKKLVTFFIINFLLTSFFQLSLAIFNPLEAGKEIYILGMIWSPAFAALITSRLYRKDFAEFGWNWGQSRYHFLSYITPFLYTFVAYLLTWSLGFGSFYKAESVQEIAKNYGWETLPENEVIILYVVVSSTLGILKAFPYALGEEIGWRGFLVPELAKTTTFFNTALISGLAWAIWHYPSIIFGGYNNGTSIPYSLFTFTLAVVAISSPMAWLRLKSGSLWTGMVFHATDNLFITDVFTRLTKETEITKYVAGEFGIAIAITSLIAGYIFWKRRAELPKIRN